MKIIYSIIEGFNKNRFDHQLDFINAINALASNSECKHSVIVLSDTNKMADSLSAYVPEILFVQSDRLCQFDKETIVMGIKKCIDKDNCAGIITMCGTEQEQYMSAVAYHFKWNYFPNAVSVSFDSGKYNIIRPIFNSKLYERTYLSGKPFIMTLADIRRKNDENQSQSYEENNNIVQIPLEETITKTNEKSLGIQPIEEKFLKTRLKPVNKKSIISGGSAFSNKFEFLKHMGPLAKYLNADIAASRKLHDTEKDWEIHILNELELKNSSSFKILAGTSGSIEKNRSIMDSSVVVAINNDGSDPVFRIADYGVIADIFKFLPIFTEKLRRKNIE